MNHQELLQSVQKHCPDVLEKTATLLAATEKLVPSFAQEVLQDFKTVTDYTTEKLASAGETARRVGTGVAISVGAGLATSIATDLYDAARRGFSKARNFKRIMEANPDLKNYDKNRLQSSFNTLHRYGPEFTSDPLMGGSLLKAVAGLEGNEHTVIKDVINARKSFLDAKTRQFSPSHIDSGADSETLEKIRHQNSRSIEDLKHTNKMKQIEHQESHRQTK